MYTVTKALPPGGVFAFSGCRGSIKKIGMKC